MSEIFFSFFFHLLGGSLTPRVGVRWGTGRDFWRVPRCIPALSQQATHCEGGMFKVAVNSRRGTTQQSPTHCGTCNYMLRCADLRVSLAPDRSRLCGT